MKSIEFFEDHVHLCFGTRELTKESMQKIFPEYRFAHVHQVHGNDIVKAQEKTSVKADAHWTQEKNLGLVVVTADCLPIFIYSQQTNFITAIHAGWRGIENGIVPRSLELILQQGFKPSDLKVVIGPHIQFQSFEVEGEVHDKLVHVAKTYEARCSSDFLAHLESVVSRPHLQNKFLVNLSQIALLQLGAMKIPFHQVRVLDMDTVTDHRFHSYRRDRDAAGRNLSWIAIAK